VIPHGVCRNDQPQTLRHAQAQISTILHSSKFGFLPARESIQRCLQGRQQAHLPVFRVLDMRLGYMVRTWIILILGNCNLGVCHAASGGISVRPYTPKRMFRAQSRSDTSIQTSLDTACHLVDATDSHRATSKKYLFLLYPLQLGRKLTGVVRTVTARCF
jgi:hypothetical protein